MAQWMDLHQTAAGCLGLLAGCLLVVGWQLLADHLCRSGRADQWGQALLQWVQRRFPRHQ